MLIDKKHISNQTKQITFKPNYLHNVLDLKKSGKLRKRRLWNVLELAKIGQQNNYKTKRIFPISTEFRTFFFFFFFSHNIAIKLNSVKVLA